MHSGVLNLARPLLDLGSIVRGVLVQHFKRASEHLVGNAAGGHFYILHKFPSQEGSPSVDCLAQVGLACTLNIFDPFEAGHPQQHVGVEFGLEVALAGKGAG